MIKLFLLIIFSSSLFVENAWSGSLTESSKINARLKPQKIHEVCLKAKKGDKINWNYTVLFFENGTKFADLVSHNHKGMTSEPDQKSA